MAIQITAPKSGYVDRTATITLSWTNTDSIYNGHQTSYEIQYKTPSASSWSTLGTVTSSSMSATLNGLFTAVEEDAEEYYYRLCVKYANFDAKNTSLGGMASGTDYSDVYSIAFHGKQVGTIKLYDGSMTQTAPLYDTVSGSKSTLNAQVTSSIKGSAPLVPASSPVAGKSRVIVANGNTRNIAGSNVTSSFSAKRGDPNGYFKVYKYKYSANYAYYAYNRSYYTYYSTNYYTYYTTNYSTYYSTNYYTYYTTNYSTYYSTNYSTRYSTNYYTYYSTYQTYRMNYANNHYLKYQSGSYKTRVTFYRAATGYTNTVYYSLTRGYTAARYNTFYKKYYRGHNRLAYYRYGFLGYRYGTYYYYTYYYAGYTKYYTVRSYAYYYYYYRYAGYYARAYTYYYTYFPASKIYWVNAYKQAGYQGRSGDQAFTSEGHTFGINLSPKLYVAGYGTHYAVLSYNTYYTISSYNTHYRIASYNTKYAVRSYNTHYRIASYNTKYAVRSYNTHYYAVRAYDKFHIVSYNNLSYTYYYYR